jgi:N-acetylmuramoyl-L-alanine amidase
MPSVLVETGFLTNKREGSFLNSAKGQDLIAKSIAKAILDYKKNLDNSFNKLISNEIPEKEKIKIPGKNPKLIYKIQFAASKRMIELKPYNFKGLNLLSRSFEDEIYRYFYGTFVKYKLANKELKKIKRKGYKKAFIVPFINNKKASLENALEIEKNFK